jgi:hypothetical protein
MGKGGGGMPATVQCRGVSGANLLTGQEAIPTAKWPDLIIGCPVIYPVE